MVSRHLLVCRLLCHTVTVFVQFQKHTHLQIFRESVSAAISKPSTDGEHPLHVGLWCRHSYTILRQWGKQWIGCLPSTPECEGIFFWQRCPKFMQVLVHLGLHRGTSARETVVVCWSRLLQFLRQKLESLQCWGGGCGRWRRGCLSLNRRTNKIWFFKHFM